MGTARRPRMPAWPAAHGWKMMTTGQGASPATWLLTEPSPRRLRPPLPREPTTSRSAWYPAPRSSAAGEPGIAWTVTGGVGPELASPPRGKSEDRPACYLSRSASSRARPTAWFREETPSFR